MESETQYDFANEEQFWHALDELLATKRDTHSLIDEALRSYLTLTTSFSEYVQSDHDLRRCAYKLYSSPLFEQNADYIRLQFLHCLLQEDDTSILHTTTTFLLADARENEHTFQLLNEEGIFPRLVTLIGSPQRDEEEGLHRKYMELLYETARVQRITTDDLTCVNDDFICHMFEIIEEVSGNVDDPYHYPVIRVLLVLNEQFMVAAHDPAVVSHGTMPLTNKVMKVLSGQGSKYKTFGENIILLLNREDETSLQLLTLKLLYLLFTTPPTYEYFYTNDLHVLVDILIRNSLDLPTDAMALRHTYLRVLYPLLEHTQLKDPPHYKRNEIRKLLTVLVGGQYLYEEGIVYGVSYFEEVDETTKRLVNRCQAVSWLKESEVATEQSGSPVDTSDLSAKSGPPALPAPRKLRKRTSSKESTSSMYIMPRLESARQSSLSMVEMTIQKERPGVLTPSRNTAKQGILEAIMRKKERPPPPKARRTGWPRMKEQKSTAEPETPDIATTEDVTAEEPQIPISDSAAAQERASKCFKKPPPAPRQRGWRNKRSQDSNKDKDPQDENPFLESEVLSTSPPTITINIPDETLTMASIISTSAIERSPFSPPEEKTLSEQSPFSPSSSASVVSNNNNSINNLVTQPTIPTTLSTDTKKTNRISSVSAALGQAQAQAIQDLEQTLEKASIHEIPKQDHTAALIPTPPPSTTESQSQPQPTPIITIPATIPEHPSSTTTTASPPLLPSSTSPSSSPPEQGESNPIPQQSLLLLRRHILAPPSQPPHRGVPGPKMELERSPFLSDDDKFDNPSPNDNDDASGDDEDDSSRKPSRSEVAGNVEDGGGDRKGEESSEDEWN